ncbi:Alkaline phosphatase synthesis transcriptional regulatory protein PhoP [Thalassoglobus neptunius]|uniref:Alkaline phosphatase synthesis transcriptional regulatory protein PhoP n=1 Tax=Thalassoglobus neptunius TaxID=1938619 RepID=A0A5C5X740_9PLAN|nr:response regulator transcription factor [Thalassoglobus neptunius]TWT58578.1 Alkaline phosphatase synthesis transcriptional regulatory protein PhoP [Thalassoglobus neptunius]
MTKPRVLIVEDEIPILDALLYNLQKENFDVTTATDGREALRKCQSQVPDIVILDLMIPPPDGLQVCRELRSDPRTKNVRILMLTAKDHETDEIVGFNMGADDYVAKPFRMRPLIERVKALLRRAGAEEPSGDITVVDGITIDRKNHMVTVDENELILTPTEFRLLWTLARQPGRTFSRNELLDCSRGEDANSMERTIDVHVRALRKKLSARAELIETIRGIGYRFKPDRI